MVVIVAVATPPPLALLPNHRIFQSHHHRNNSTPSRTTTRGKSQLRLRIQNGIYGIWEGTPLHLGYDTGVCELNIASARVKMQSGYRNGIWKPVTWILSMASGCRKWTGEQLRRGAQNGIFGLSVFSGDSNGNLEFQTWGLGL